MRLSTARIQPVEESEADEAQLEALKSLQREEEPPNILKTLLHHSKLMKRWLVFANHILFKSALHDRDREILILRTGWLCQSEYEWGQHVRIGLASGLSEEEIERIKKGSEAPEWSELDHALLKAADELHEDSFISDDTWNKLNKWYNTKQLMDLVFTVGQYHLVSMALNTFGVELDDNIKGFDR